VILEGGKGKSTKKTCKLLEGKIKRNHSREKKEGIMDQSKCKKRAFVVSHSRTEEMQSTHT